MNVQTVCCCLIKMMKWAFLLLILSPGYSQVANPINSQSNNEQITNLMTAICRHQIQPEEVLDPRIDQKERVANLLYFKDPSYQLRLVPTGEIKVSADGSASVPVQVRFKSENREIETSNTVRFVKRDGIWYFASFNFLEFPATALLIIILGVSVSVAWAAGVLFVRSRLVRKKQLHGLNWIKIFIPFFWRSLSRL